MPPKKKGRGGSPKKAARRSTRSSAKRGDADTESEKAATSDEEDKGFSKEKLQMSVMRYDYPRLLKDTQFEHQELIVTIEPGDFNMDYYNETGLEKPLLFHCSPERLGMKMPSADTFTVNDVLEMVGGDRQIEVVEVTGQGSVKMSLRDFVDYYNLPQEEREKKALYNVLSLEFSLSKLVDFVSGPELVRQIDWVENHWPDALRQRFIRFTKQNLFQIHQTFPKVQHYCLMSVSRCFTDFHIDFGGTSVWYHVLKGQKVFWLVAPTDENIAIYEEYSKNPEQTGFFGDVVTECVRVVLNAGDTMMIPSGWIHAVYTPVDSIVFGGNFIHSMRAAMQIKVNQSENKINITKKFRFPYAEELIFYTIADFVQETTGRIYLRPFRLQDARYDYVGKRWIDSKGHHKMITKDNFSSVLDDSMQAQLPDEDISEDPGAVNVIAMHAENSMYADMGLEEEADEEDQLQAESAVGENSKLNGQDNTSVTAEEEINCYAENVFYHKRSIMYDLHGRSTMAHRNPVPKDEPAIQFNQDELSKINNRLLYELERLLDYIRRKRLVDIGEGITRPASLLAAFAAVLQKRREQLEAEGETLVDSPWAKPKKRAYKRSSNADQSLISPVKRTNGRRRKGDVDESNDDSFNLSREASECVTTDSQEVEMKQEQVRRLSSVELDEGIPLGLRSPVFFPKTINDFELKFNDDDVDSPNVTETAAAKETEEDDPLTGDNVLLSAYANESDGNLDLADEKKHDAESAVDPAEPTDESFVEVDVVGGADDEVIVKPKKEKKPKTEVVSEKERVKKEKEREREKLKKAQKRKSAASKSFEDALHPPKPKKKHDSKKDKPQYVGGLPMAPIQNEPAVPNLYNYDPKMEMMKLGTGQLQSAYRKTRTNIAPPTEKKIYKLEPKHHDDTDATVEYPPVVHPSDSMHDDPLSIQTYRTLPESSVQNSPAARSSFMPHLGGDIHSPPGYDRGSPKGRRLSTGGASWERSPSFTAGGGAAYSPGAPIRSSSSNAAPGPSYLTSTSNDRPAPISPWSNESAAFRNRSESDAFSRNLSNTSSTSEMSPPAPLMTRGDSSVSGRYSDGDMLNSPANSAVSKEESWRSPSIQSASNRPSDPRDPRSRGRSSVSSGSSQPAQKPVELIPAPVATLRLHAITMELDELNATK